MNVIEIQDKQKNSVLQLFEQHGGFPSDLYRVVLFSNVYRYERDYRSFLAAGKRKPVEDDRHGMALLRQDPISKEWSLARFNTQNRSERLDLTRVDGWLQEE